MSLSRRSFVRKTMLLLVAGVALLVGIVGVSIWLSERSGSYFVDVVAARDVRSSSADLMSLMQDAESGQRGYLLTRDPSYLLPYEEALSRFGERYDALSDAVRRWPELVPAMSNLSLVLKAKLVELRHTVDLGREGRFDDALAAVREGTGKRLMDQARGEFTTLLTRSEAGLRASMQAQGQISTQLRWATIAGAVAILAMAAFAVWTVLQYVRELAAAQDEVDQLNAGLEDKVKERTEALMKANDEIQRFAYIVTHDLRAPLVNIMGFTSELEESLKPIQALASAAETATPKVVADARLAATEDLPEAIGFIRTSTRKMDGLINAILKISREGTRQLRPDAIDLDAVLDTAAAVVHHQAVSAGGDIIVDSQVGSIVSDRLSLDQIVGNLLDNAIKYRRQEVPLRIVARARRHQTGVITLDVQDNGRGIEEKDHDRIFELFRRSGAQNTKGEGIGLAHVRTLVRNLGGDITVTSVPGKGSTFSMVIPADLRTVKRSSSQ